MNYQIPTLPLDDNIETIAVLKSVALARSALAEMKGTALSIPNESILINTLSLQEAKDSSAIENIITTHDELYAFDYTAQDFSSVASKEVHRYAEALQWGFRVVKEQGILTNNHIIKIQSALEGHESGFRKVPGTTLKNEQTGEVVYTPPQSLVEIKRYMENLESFLNESELSLLDPLVKMAIIHHQFESIHPFYDGNGRTGRIINILFLVKEGLMNLPILYLSRFINRNKSDYYRLLQSVREKSNWEEWILFMLEGVTRTSLETIETINGIKQSMQKYKNAMRKELPKVYSQDLLNNLFRHPYTKIDFVMRDLSVSRPTATSYLNQLESIGLIKKHRIGRENFYINHELFRLLANVSH